MSLDLLMGYTGLVSFGHAAFYGLGAYATAILLERGVLSVWACLGAALVVVGLYAAVVSYFATARRGIYFALRSEEHTSELQSRFDLVCRLLLEKKNTVH